MLNRVPPSARSFLINNVHVPNEEDTRRRVWRRSQSQPTHQTGRLTRLGATDDDCPAPATIWPLLSQAVDPGPQHTSGMDVTLLFAPLPGLTEATTLPVNRVMPAVTSDVTVVSGLHPLGRIHVAVPVGGINISTLNHLLGPGGYCSQHCIVTAMCCAICDSDDADLLKCAFCAKCFHFDCIGLDRLSLFLATLDGSFYKCGACTLISYPQ